MGGTTTKNLARSTLAVATGGGSLVAERMLRGKSAIGKDIKNIGKTPDVDVPEAPERPTFDIDFLKQRALIDRIRQQTIRAGRSPVRTSPSGVTRLAPVLRTRLQGA
jgi:hypothetical protein